MAYIYNLSFKLTKFQKNSLSLIKHHKHSKTYPHRHTCPSVSFSCACVWVTRLHAQSCLTLCDLMHCSTPGSSFHGIFQARILEWVTISSPGDPSYPGIKFTSPASPAWAGGSLTTEPPRSMRVTFRILLIFHGIRFSVVFILMIMTLLSTSFFFFRIDCRCSI